MLKIQTVLVAVSGCTDAEIQGKISAALSGNRQIVDVMLKGQPLPAPSSANHAHVGGLYKSGQAFADLGKVDHYVVWTEEDVTPILLGPYESDEERLVQAKLLRDRNASDSMYRLDVPAGTPNVSVDTFTGEEMEGEDLVTEICRSLARGDKTWAQIATSDHLTFQFMGEEVLVNAKDRMTVARVLKQNLYLVPGETQDYVVTGMRLGEVFTMDMWRAEVAAAQTTAGYDQWLANKSLDLGRVCYAFPGKI